MTGFILKDLLNLRRYARTIAVFIAFFAVMTFSLDESGYMSAMIAILFAMLPVTSFVYDQQSRWDLFAQTLPVSRRDIVAAKYALALALIVAGTVIGTVLTLVVGLIKGTPVNPGDLLLPGGFIFAASILFVSVMFPLIYKFGVEKGRILMLMAMGVAVMVGLLMKRGGIALPAETSPGAALCAALIAAALIMAGSFFISKAIYETRDL